MFQIFREEKIITICILSFFAVSILMRLLLGILYQNMIREAENMATTDHKLLKQCKLKFANCYQLNHGVPNIPVFVDKFLGRLALGPLSFESMYHLSGQAMLLSVVSAGVGICKSILDGRMLGEILPFYIVSFLELYLYFSITTMLDVKGRKRILKINLVDYLENHLSARIGVTEEDIEMLYGSEAYGTGAYGPVRRRKNSPAGKDSMGRNAAKTGRRTVEFTPISNKTMPLQEPEEELEQAAQEQSPDQEEREKELEELLKEFLAT